MAKRASMVWSPLSNLLLYGETADVGAARPPGCGWASARTGRRAAARTCWASSGRPARYAATIGGIPDRDLLAMATIDAAGILGWDAALGSLEAGKRADILVVAGATHDPYAHLFTCTETDVDLVVINGVPRYGASTTMRKLLGESAAQAEVGSAGGRARLLFLIQATGDPVTGKVSLKEATDLLADGLHRLPELAKDVDKQKVSPEDTFLVLDHEEEDGVDQRPHLPGPGRRPGRR